MEQRANEGYIITDSIHVGNAEFVIGENETQYGTMFVTWRCSNGTDYYWGHYFNDRFAAQKDLVARAQEEVKYLELKNQPPEQQKPPKKRSVNDDGYDNTAYGPDRAELLLFPKSADFHADWANWTPACGYGQ